MSRRVALFLILLVQLVIASDEQAVVRQQEEVLANAVNAKDKTVLATLIDKDFHVSWSYGSIVRSFRINMTREEWINRLSAPVMESYDIEILHVERAGRNAAQVMLNEFFTLRSPRGRRVQKRAESIDLWVQQQEAWKLVSRLSHFDVRD